MKDNIHFLMNIVITLIFIFIIIMITLLGLSYLEEREQIRWNNQIDYSRNILLV